MSSSAVFYGTVTHATDPGPPSTYILIQACAIIRERHFLKRVMDVIQLAAKQLL